MDHGEKRFTQPSPKIDKVLAAVLASRQLGTLTPAWNDKITNLPAYKNIKTSQPIQVQIPKIFPLKYRKENITAKSTNDNFHFW